MKTPTLLISNLEFLRGKEFCLSQGNLLIQDGYIQEILSPGVKVEADIELDGTSYLGVPAFVNAHIHLLDRLWKEKWIGGSIQNLFSPQGWKSQKLASIRRGKGEAWIPWIKEGLKELLRCGVSTACVYVEEGMEGAKIIAQGVKEMDIGPDLILLGRPMMKPVSKEEIEELLTLCDGLGLASTGNYSNADLKLMSSYQDQAILSTHIAEYQETANFSQALDFFQPHFFVHGNYLTQQEREIMSQKQLPLVNCFRSSRTFGLSTPDLIGLDKIHLPWALATDNFMVNSPNLLREIAFVARTLHGEKGNLLPPFAISLLSAITYRAAKILGFSQRGVLEKNFESDILLFRKSPALSPFKNLWTFILRGDLGDLEWIIRKGKLIKRSEIQ